MRYVRTLTTGGGAPRSIRRPPMNSYAVESTGMDEPLSVRRRSSAIGKAPARSSRRGPDYKSVLPSAARSSSARIAAIASIACVSPAARIMTPRYAGVSVEAGLRRAQTQHLWAAAQVASNAASSTQSPTGRRYTTMAS